MNTTYKIDLSRFPEFRITLLLRIVPMMILLLVFFLFINQGKSSDIYTLLVFIVIVVFSILNIIRKQKKAWESYQLIWTDEAITRKQAGTREAVIEQDDIKSGFQMKVPLYFHLHYISKLN